MPSTESFIDQLSTASPKGFFAWGPDELKRLRRMEESVRRLFCEADFLEVSTPVVEFAATVEGSLKPTLANRIFRLTDRMGDHLALRYDMTTPVARLFASTMAKNPRPVKLSYFGPVYRQTGPHEGRAREHRQAGCECFGGERPASAAAMVELAIRSLKELGIARFKIDIGHTGLFPGLVGSHSLAANLQETVRDAIHRKDSPELERILAETQLPSDVKQALLRLPEMYGQEEIFLQAATLSSSAEYKTALDELHAVYGDLMSKGYAEFISVDLGVVRDMEYYTGIVFEGLTPGCGAPVCAGGEYDNLTAQFGLPAAAVGFVLELDEIFHLVA